MTIGDRIRTIRENLGLSQLELAQKMGLQTKGAVSHIENAGNDITLKNIRRAADALGVDPGVLMGWDEEAKEERINEELANYLRDPEMKCFVLYAGGNIPPGRRKEYLDALRYTIDTLNRVAGGKD